MLFLFGVAIGSFLNVFILRYGPDKPLFSFKRLLGRSKCMSCKKTLSPFELIPIVSFFFLRGRCKTCRTRISFQYPFVEFMSGAIFAGIPIFLNSFYHMANERFFLLASPWWYYILVAFWVTAFLALLVMFIIDLRHYIIPDELHFVFIAIAIGISAILFFAKDLIFPFRESFLENYVLVFSPFLNIFLNKVLGCLIAGIFFIILFFISSGRGMGMGDVKLAFSLGLLFGWPDIGLAIMLAFISGGIWSSILFFVRAKTMKDRVPFAPFFVIGTTAVFLFGHGIIGWYFSLFGM